MSEQATAETGADRMSVRTRLALAGCVLLLVALRLRWVGHLLSWDEAMNLCAARSFAGGVTDYFSRWFWHHPPLFNLLLLAAGPFRPGFAERGQVLVIVVSALNLLALFLVNRRILGTQTALWSCFFLAVLPAAAFYDVWLKPDVLVILFGLLAIHFFAGGHRVVPGVLLGLALLTKEMAAFYAMAIGLIWLLQRPRRPFKDLLVVFGLAAVLSAWWYLAFSVSIKYFFEFGAGIRTGTDVGHWEEPWHYFVRLLPVDLGLLGGVLALVGAVSLARPRGSARSWPLYLVVPAFLIFSLAPGKAAWFLVTLLPGFATLAGAGAWSLLRARGGETRPWLRALLGVAIAVAAVAGVAVRDYEEAWQGQSYELWQGATMSRQAADTMNRLVSDGERALITPMYYWRTLQEKPCPIFTYYLKDIPVVVRRADIPLEPLVELIRKYQLDWVMYSRNPDLGYGAVIDPMMKQYNVPVVFLDGACVLRVTSIHQSAPAPGGPP